MPVRRVAKTPQADAQGRRDDELMAQLAAGRTSALAELYTQHGRMVFAILGRYGGGVELAELEELRQEVFLTLCDTASRYRGDGTLRSWLCGIAVRKARAYRAKQGWRRALLGRFGSHAGGALPVALDTRPDHGDLRRELDAALGKLPAAQRDVLLLSSVEGLSGEEIAEILEISPKTVWTRLHRARHAMRQALAEMELDVPQGGTNNEM